MGAGMAAWQLIRFVLAFGVVIAAAAMGSRWLAARARGGPAARGAGLRVLAGLSLGAGRSLCVVQVGRSALVLALGDREVRLVHTVTDPEEVVAIGGGSSERASGIPFVQALAQALRRAAPATGAVRDET